MVILLNGAFGVGKTTVAQALQREQPWAMVFDPEHVGFVLQRAARWLPLDGAGTDDYQDLPAWRTLSVQGIRMARWVRPTIIVPMTFSNLEYLNEVRDGVRSFDPDVRHLCLVAPLDVVEQRLLSRGSDTVSHAWAHRRAAECCAAHHRPEFGEQIPTDGRSVSDVVQDILSRLSGKAA